MDPLAVAVFLSFATHASTVDLRPGAQHLVADAEFVAVVDGRVVLPDGRSPFDVTVWTATGSRAHAAVDGSFRLEIAWPAGADVVHVFARSSQPDGTWRGERVVSRSDLAVDSRIGELMLTTSASCTPEWVPWIGSSPGVAISGSSAVAGGGWPDMVTASAVIQEGGKSVLFVAGSFSHVGTTAAQSIAKWDGEAWSALAPGVPAASVRVMTNHDDGTGDALYVAGTFEELGGVAGTFRVARWNGASWSPLGSLLAFCGNKKGAVSEVRALLTHDDGSGPALYVGGQIQSFNPFVFGPLRWDGTNWSMVGGGVGPTNALTSFDFGSGPRLLAAVNSGVRQWDGATWSPVGTAFNASVRALASVPSGSAAGLYAGGHFRLDNGAVKTSLARWEGSAWMPVSSIVGLTHYPGTGIEHLHAVDHGQGAVLYAAGALEVPASSYKYLMSFDGTSTAQLGGNLTTSSSQDSALRTLATFSTAHGRELVFGGRFSAVGGERAAGIATWNGETYGPIGTGLNSDVFALHVAKDDPEQVLYAGGWFGFADGVRMPRVARWDGDAWAPLGAGFDGAVVALETFDAGGGPALHAGGTFTHSGSTPMVAVAKWDGAAWQPLPGTLNGTVSRLRAIDDGSGEVLYVAGSFTKIDDRPIARLARWDGSKWSQFGQPNGVVRAIESHDDGTGTAIYVGGEFSNIGGVPTGVFARWDGATWSSPSPLPGTVRALASIDDGSGAALYVAGRYLVGQPYGGEPITKSYVARWTGQWTPMVWDESIVVDSLFAHDDGNGTALYAAGTFWSIGGVAARNVARWGGGAWHPLGGGVHGGSFYGVTAAASRAESGVPELFVGGALVPDSLDHFIGRWTCPPAGP